MREFLSGGFRSTSHQLSMCRGSGGTVDYSSLHRAAPVPRSKREPGE